MVQSVNYLEPRRIWVDDGHVCIEAYDGIILKMTPELAISMGRRLSEAGTESLINRVIDKTGDADPG